MIGSPSWRWWTHPQRGSFLSYCLVAWHLALIPSLLLVLLAYAVFSGVGADMDVLRKPARDIQQRNIWIALVIAPAIETAVLALGIRLISVATKRPETIAIASALVWGALHAWFHPLWFFGTVWSFYVFSRAYLAWRPVSVKHALGAAAMPHALVNSSALLMQFFAR